MNIAMLTTWASPCGIAEYSKNLVQEYLKLGHNVFIFCNSSGLTENPAFFLVGAKDAHLFVEQVFGVSWWGEDPKFMCDKILSYFPILEKKYGKIDIFHIQYQSSLYQPEGFNKLLTMLPCPIVMTCHDSTVNQKHIFPVEKNIITVVHNPDITAEYYIPFPTIKKTPVVFSFGMGRNDYDFIKESCGQIGINFEYHDGRKDGWWTEEKLFSMMGQADAIVLWYNEVPLQGQSSALRTAISSLRPVIVNDVGWFKDAPKFVRMAWDKNSLQRILMEVLHLDYIRENSFNRCALKYLEVYNEVSKG